METFTAALGLVSENCFFGSIDLQDAYYSCPVHKSDRKFLKILLEGSKISIHMSSNGSSISSEDFYKIVKTSALYVTETRIR